MDLPSALLLNYLPCLQLSSLKDKPRQGEDFKESLARMRDNPKPILEHELSEFKVNSQNAAVLIPDI